MKANPFLWKENSPKMLCFCPMANVCHLGLTTPGSYVQSPRCPKAIRMLSSISRKHRQKWSLLRRARESPLGCQHRESTWKSPGEDRWPEVRGDPGPRVTQLESQSVAAGPEVHGQVPPQSICLCPCPCSPSPGTCTDTQPAGDHRYTLLPPVQMASRGCCGPHWKARTVQSCSSTASGLSFRMSQIHTALGTLSEEEGAPRLTFTPRCSAPAPSLSPLRMPTFPRGRKGKGGVSCGPGALLFPKQSRERGGLGLSGCWSDGAMGPRHYCCRMSTPPAAAEWEEASVGGPGPGGGRWGQHTHGTGH